jgi:hypothetical protein
MKIAQRAIGLLIASAGYMVIACSFVRLLTSQ